PACAARRDCRAAGAAVVLCAVVVGGLLATTFRASAADAVVSIDTTTTTGTLATRLATGFVWPGSLDRATGTRSRFNALAPPLVRVNVTTDGYPQVMPAGVTQGSWNFANLDPILNDVRQEGGQVVLTLAYAPQ